MAPAVRFEIRDNGVIASHPAWPDVLLLGTGMMAVLLAFAHPRTTSEAIEVLSGSLNPSSTETAIEALIRDGLVVEHLDFNESELPAPWNFWGIDTWRFHALASSVKFLDEESEIWLLKASREDRPPVSALVRSREGLDSLAQDHGTGALAEIFARRRTVRGFSARAIPRSAVSELISETFRVRETIDADYFGLVAKKSYPSAGARHEIRVAVVAWNIDGLPSGVYWYDDAADALILTDQFASQSDLEQVTANQGFLSNASFGVMAFCEPATLAWKYRSPRGYLDAYVNAGHAMQNLLLYAANLDLSAWMTTAIDMRSASRLFGADESWFPVSFAAFGKAP